MELMNVTAPRRIGTPRMGYLLLMNFRSVTLVTSPSGERTTMASFSGPRMRIPSISACPPIVVRNAPCFFSICLNDPFCDKHTTARLKMQQLFDYLQFFFCLPLQRQADSHHSAASGGIGDVKLAAVEVDDLIADR